jgi:hypothetical protein
MSFEVTLTENFQNYLLNGKPISPEFLETILRVNVAMKLAYEDARQTAIQHKTPLIIQQNGQMVKLVVH